MKRPCGEPISSQIDGIDSFKLRNPPRTAAWNLLVVNRVFVDVDDVVCCKFGVGENIFVGRD